MDDKPKIRVVSKAQYVLHVTVKTILSSVGGVTVVLGISGTLLSLFVALVTLRWWVFSAFFFLWILSAVAVCVVSVTLVCVGAAAIRKLQCAETVVPLTRHSISNLPEHDTLVRPLRKPFQEPEEHLLRAAYDKKETIAEELVRPQL